MCIRDRYETLALNIFGVSKANLEIMQRMRTLFLEAEIKDCLLYTSDAADERSSVDLGGRRIIKKKKDDIDMAGVLVPSIKVIKIDIEILMK